MVRALFERYRRGHGRAGSGRGFLGLSERARADSVEIIRRLQAEFGDMPLAAPSDPRARGVFLDWRDRRAETAPRRADHDFAVLARAFALAFDRRLILANPLERAGRVWRGSRRERSWSGADEAAFLRTAPPRLRFPALEGPAAR